MLFNSIDFAVFLPIVFILYWFVFNRKLKNQNILILVASYIFYGWWDYRFLSLIIISSTVDYLIGLRLFKTDNVTIRKFLLLFSIIVNIGALAFFKYYNFFLENFINAFSLFGKKIDATFLHIILPVGISFYTFQTLSYTIDVYRKKLKPTKDFIAFASFVSFFPQLVAGPIERASNLLPQFFSRRSFSYTESINGLKQILWGLFKKLVIADNCGKYVDLIFGNSESYTGSALLIGAVFFAFQIYGDFSGYSDIAIGVAKLFGFHLMQNFAYPYFSRDIAEFWRRWHISLSTWFRDYLYIPLGGSRGNFWIRIRNIFIIFLVSGFWHGASWTFIIWGGLNAMYFLPLMIFDSNRKNIQIVAKDKSLPNFKEFTSILITFIFTVFAWIFFRADSISHAILYIGGIFKPSIISKPNFSDLKGALTLTILIIFLIIIEWIGRVGPHPLYIVGNKWKRPYRWLFYSFVIFLIGLFMATTESPFIYFQF